MSEMLETLEYNPEKTGFRALIRGDVQREVAGLVEELDERIAELDEKQKALQDSTKEALTGLLFEVANATDHDSETEEVREKLQSFVRPAHEHMPLLDVSASARIPIWLHGEAGSGKSTAAEVVADRRSLEFRSISLCPTTTKSDLLGYRDANGEYRRTGFRQTYEEGGVFLFDEIDNAHPSSLAIINHALANGIAEFPDKQIEMHPDAIIVAAANTIGRGANAQYVGRSVIDAATLDRFVFIPWDIDETLEESIVTGSVTPRGTSVYLAEGGVPSAQEWLKEVRKFRQQIAVQGLRHICSTRAAIYGSELARRGVGRTWLRELCIYKGMSAADRRKLENPNQEAVDF